jgi:hypothetical protein
VTRRLRSALAPPPPGRAGRHPVPDHPDHPGEVGATASRHPPMPGPLILDLVAALVQGGAPPAAALRSVGAALQAVADPRGPQLLAASARLDHPIAPTARAPAVETAADGLAAVLDDALGLAARSGLPPTALLRRSAAEERRRNNAAQLRAVRRLEVLLVIPAGLCLLPAFVLLGVVPVALDLILG